MLSLTILSDGSVQLDQGVPAAWVKDVAFSRATVFHYNFSEKYDAQ